MYEIMRRMAVEVNDLKGKVEGAENEIVKTNTKLANHETEIKSHEKGLKSHETKFDDLKKTSSLLLPSILPSKHTPHSDAQATDNSTSYTAKTYIPTVDVL